MVEHRALKAGLALASLLAFPALLPAQVITPHIDNIQSGFGAATNGAAITVGTPSPAGCSISSLCLNLFLNGNFNDDVDVEVDWNGGSLNVLSQTSTQLIVNVPSNLYSSAGTVGTATITVTEFSGCESNCPHTTSTYTVNAAMASISSLATGIVGRAYAHPFFTGGTGNSINGPNFTVQFNANPAPPGLAPDSSNPPLLTGTPTQSGTFPVNPTITDSWGNKFTVNDSVIILDRLAITTASLPNGSIQHSYNTTVNASGGVTPYTWGAAGLPGGLGINSSTGAITGTPTQAGTFPVTVTVTDSGGETNGQSAQANYNLKIDPLLTITTASLPAGSIQHPYSTTVAASGGATPYTWGAAVLPGGLGINSSTGAITGTPTASGTFPVTVTVTDSGGAGNIQSAQANYNLTINALLTITTASLPAGSIQHPYSTTVAATGGATPYTWGAAGLPGGLGINSATGAITGTPTASGTFPVTVTVTDSGGAGNTQSAQANYNLTIDAQLTITTASLPAGSIQHPYSTTVAASGGATPYTWGAAGLPGGLAINSTTGAITGTPTAAGTFPVTVTVTDSGGASNTQSAQANYNLTINAQLTITTASLPAGTIQHPYSTTVAATGGATPYTWGAVGLPAGLGINSATGAISGTPTASGTFPVTVTVTDSGGASNGQSAQANYNLTINALLTITTSTLPAGRIQQPYNAAVTASGGAAPYTWSAVGLPAGLGINSATGAISGTPTVSGTFPVTVTVTDSGGPSNGQSAQANYNLTINSLLTITTTTLPAGRVQLAYSATVAASGGVTPYTWTAAGLPTGLSINSSTGAISGTPTNSGTFPVNVSVSDSSGQNTATTLSLQIIPLLTITTTSLPQGTAAVGYSAAVVATGGVTPYTFTATGLPAGLGINSSTGAISGTPTSSGTSSVTLRVTDSGGSLAQSAQASYSVTINPPPVPPLQITTPTLSGGTVGQIYSAVIGATGGSGGYSFSVTSGSLPGGVQLALAGQLYGTPTSPGTFNFTAQVTDSSNNSVTHGYSIVIAPGPLTVTGTPPATVAVNSSISVQFGATGGVSPYKLTASGSLPTGTSFNNGSLSGTASAPGTFSFTVTVTDSETPPVTVSQGYSITVTPGPLVISASLPPGQVGQSYSGQFSATGGTGGYVWSGSAGNGLTVSTGGAVSGTPNSEGTVSISVTVTDSSGTKASGNFSVVIAGPALIVTTTTLTSGALTVPYSATLAASGGTTPYTWTATGLPDGLSVASATGSISGTPTAMGVFTVNVTVKDSAGATAPATLSLTINAAPLTITTTSITPPAIGSSFTQTLTATGGTTPYTWTATGLPSGVTLSTDGTLSGTPASTGTSSVTFTVKDANGQMASKQLDLVVTLPSTAPSTSFNGFPANGAPGTQVTSAITFSAPYPVDVTVNLTLTFAPASGPDDPNVQFASGGRTTSVIVKAGSTVSLNTIAIQTGTVAGVITITEQLIAQGTNITPLPTPTRTITIAASAPTVTSVTVTPGSSAFTVVVVGFDPTRAITQVNFTFTAATGATLQTSTVTIPAQTLFSQWYQSAASVPFGSQFSFTITFTVNGSANSIASVTVTLTNPTGTSPGVTAPV
jgi:Putative Ig domain